MPPFVRYPRDFLAKLIREAISDHGHMYELPPLYVDHCSARNRWVHPLLPDTRVGRCTFKGDGVEDMAVYSLRCNGSQSYAYVFLP